MGYPRSEGPAAKDGNREMTRADMVAFRRNRLTTLARLRRINHAIAQLDEYEAAQIMPPDIQHQVRSPDLSRDALQSLCQVLEEALKDLEVMWERRN
jgi:hypothetical protein